MESSTKRKVDDSESLVPARAGVESPNKETVFFEESLTSYEQEIALRNYVLKDQENKDWCDILLFGKDSAVSPGISAHKVILASASPHLRDAFKSEGFIDSGTKQYHIDQIEHECLQLIVSFIYSSTLKFTSENTGSRLKLLLIGADYLLMPELVSLCGRHLGRRPYLHAATAVSMCLFAQKYHCRMLEDAAVRAIASNFSATQPDCVNLNLADTIGLLDSLVKLRPSGPDLACQLAVEWLRFQEAGRKTNCDEIMVRIPLNLMSADALQRASEASCLSTSVLWAIKQVLGMRIEVDRVNASMQASTKKSNKSFRF